MKGLLISLAAGAVVICTAVIAKKVNDSREEYVDISGTEEIRSRETFKEAAIRKVNEILRWVGENEEKVKSAVTVVGVLTSVVELINAIKCACKNRDKKLFEELDEIKTVLNRPYLD